MKDRLIAILELLGYPVRLQGSLGLQEAYPDSFFTFWNDSTEDGNHYDNKAATVVWSFQVNFYSIDPELVNEALLNAKALLEAEGFTVPGKGHDVPTDEPTHTGRAIDVLFLQRTDNEIRRLVTVPDTEFDLAINEEEPERFSHLAWEKSPEDLQED